MWGSAARGKVSASRGVCIHGGLHPVRESVSRERFASRGVGIQRMSAFPEGGYISRGLGRLPSPL